ncbi:uncharacterized protein LOC113318835 [Papaver somniferum]|uniref:uncharacterized protein LOC113318835 n=1 Tax=Papaver somniferum TaxID=3469 RepID=UPI000E6FCE1D|nr:uncharacterized protein LOC113318835 [Papaver somniferum]
METYSASKSGRELKTLTTWSPPTEMFFITIHNLTHAQLNSDNLRRYLAYMGDISSFSYPIRKENGSYSITVRASIRYKQRLCFSAMAENEMGFTIEIRFQFHHFPNNFCDYCKLIGHKFQNRQQQLFDQQQAEQQQAAADAIMAAMQLFDAQQHEAIVNQQPEVPVMQQQGLNYHEDSLDSAETGHALSEVTCTEYLKHLEVEDASQNSDKGISMGKTGAGTSSNHLLRADALPFYHNSDWNKDSYMWKVV